MSSTHKSSLVDPRVFFSLVACCPGTRNPSSMSCGVMLRFQSCYPLKSLFSHVLSLHLNFPPSGESFFFCNEGKIGTLWLGRYVFSIVCSVLNMPYSPSQPLSAPAPRITDSRSPILPPLHHRASYLQLASIMNHVCSLTTIPHRSRTPGIYYGWSSQESV